MLNNITPSDIVAEINITGSSLKTGQIQVPVSISVPNKGKIWAYGN